MSVTVDDSKVVLASHAPASSAPGTSAPAPSASGSGTSVAPPPSSTGSTGAAGASYAGAPAGQLSAATEQALMDRWNAANYATTKTVDFTWTEYDHFPHPTFKLGTAEAYGAFAAVLLQFFELGDDFDFLASEHLFTTPLLYVSPSGQIGIDTNFKKLATDFSSSTGFGNAPPATRQALAAFLARIP